MLRDHSQERRVGFTRAEIFTHLDTKHGKRVVARFRRAADMLEERGVVTSLRVGREIDWTYWLPPQGIRSEEERKVRWVTKVFRQITDPKAFADNVVNAGVITLLLTVMLQILGGLLHLLGISG